MRIEEEIKQERFANDHQKAIINIVFTAGWINGESNSVLKPFGISIQQYNILRILRGQKGNPISVNNLIDRMLDKSSNASRLVEKLRQRGYVDRKTCEYDRRQVDVFITQAGLDFLEELIPAFDAMHHASNLTEEEASQLSDLLDKMRG